MASHADNVGGAGPGDGRAPGGARRWAWAAAWLGATALLVWIRPPLDLAAVPARLRAAEPRWIALALALNLAALALWTRQWRWLTPPALRASWAAIAEVISLSAAAMNTLPFPWGHSVGVGLLARRARFGWDAAVSVMALDQLCEGAAKLLLFLVAAWVAPLPGWIHRAALALSGGVLALFATLALLAWLARQARPGAGRLLRWARHLGALRDPGALGGALAMGVAIKCAQAGAIYAAQRSLGIRLPVRDLAPILAAVEVATMIAVAPGGLAVYEAAAVVAYRYLGLAPGPALAVALLQHACFLLPMVLPGYGVTAWRALAGGGEGRGIPGGRPPAPSRPPGGRHGSR